MPFWGEREQNLLENFVVFGEGKRFCANHQHCSLLRNCLFCSHATILLAGEKSHAKMRDDTKKPTA